MNLKTSDTPHVMFKSGLHNLMLRRTRSQLDSKRIELNFRRAGRKESSPLALSDQNGTVSPAGGSVTEDCGSGVESFAANESTWIVLHTNMSWVRGLPF